MLSFFGKKKPSPDATPVTVIQGPVDPNQTQQQSNGAADDFIFIERRPGSDNPQDARGGHMYPPMPPAYHGNYNHGLVYPQPTMPTISNNKQDNTTASYLQDVPFTLAPQLCTKNDFALTQMQVDGMLALMTRQMSVDERDDYNFSLERAIQNECY